MWTHHGHNSQNKIHHNLEKQKDPTVQMPWRIATNTSNSKRISFIFLWRVLGTVRYFFKNNSIHKLCISTSSNILLLDTELCAPKSETNLKLGILKLGTLY